KNCCVPHRDCLGAACIAGRCEPIVVVSDATTDARGIGVSGDTLVWATGCTGIVRRVRNDGSGNAALPKGPDCTPTLALSTDGTSVFWIEWDGPYLNTAAIDGTTPSKIVAQNPISGA